MLLLGKIAREIGPGQKDKSMLNALCPDLYTLVGSKKDGNPPDQILYFVPIDSRIHTVLNLKTYMALKETKTHRGKWSCRYSVPAEPSSTRREVKFMEGERESRPEVVIVSSH